MKSPVEHMFGSHEWCDWEWYWAKDAQETELDIAKLVTSHTSITRNRKCEETECQWIKTKLCHMASKLLQAVYHGNKNRISLNTNTYNIISKSLSILIITMCGTSYLLKSFKLTKAKTILNSGSLSMARYANMVLKVT